MVTNSTFCQKSLGSIRSQKQNFTFFGFLQHTFATERPILLVCCLYLCEMISRFTKHQKKETCQNEIFRFKRPFYNEYIFNYFFKNIIKGIKYFFFTKSFFNFLKQIFKEFSSFQSVQQMQFSAMFHLTFVFLKKMLSNRFSDFFCNHESFS